MEGVGDADSVTSWGWRRQSLQKWPDLLPEGLGGNWAGWRSSPIADLEWQEAMRLAVQRTILAQYEAAGISVPESIGWMSNPRCRAVTVGHQLVIAGGASFFHHKILTAIRVAKALAKRSGHPVVPVFWLASEDHDFDEIRTVHGRHGTHTWARDNAHVPMPVGTLPLTGLRAALEAFVNDGVPVKHGEKLIRCLEESERRGESLAGLTRRWIHDQFAEHGLVVLDPMDARLKSMASHLWASEFVGEGIFKVVGGQSDSKEGAFVRENNVFWMDKAQGRVGVVASRTREGWSAGSISLNEQGQDWESWAEENAQRCSPGVLLRPLYQEFLLNSMAVVVGPGEWKYWSQLPEAFEHHGLAFPALRLRDHALVQNEATWTSFWSLNRGWFHDEEWDREVVKLWLKEFEPKLASLKAKHDAWMEEVNTWTEDEIPALSGASGALRAASNKAWEQWRRKLGKTLKGSRSEDWQLARNACTWLFRNGQPQDRWANWAVLAQTDERLDEWTEEWGNPDLGLAAQVWRFEPLEMKS